MEDALRSVKFYTEKIELSLKGSVSVKTFVGREVGIQPAQPWDRGDPSDPNPSTKPW